MLSNRLELIATMVPPGCIAGDIGTDHGYLPIALVKRGIAKKAYAMDVNQGPLDKASHNIGKAGLEDKIKAILSDGLALLPLDVTVVIIAGMGGRLIGEILETKQDKLAHVESLILSPHLDHSQLRKTLHQLGWQIHKEAMVMDNHHHYTVMKCTKGMERYTELEYKYGKSLMANRDKVWLKYLKEKQDNLKGLCHKLKAHLTDKSKNRLEEVYDEINEIERVLKDES